jgi:hypothetical protein
VASARPASDTVGGVVTRAPVGAVRPHPVNNE